MKSKIVRTDTFAGGGITPEEKLRMDKHAQMWIDRVMRTEPIKKDKIVPAIKSLYAAAGLKEPRVVIVPSPLVMAFAGGFASQIWKMRKKGKDFAPFSVFNATRDATLDATDNATYAATGSATDSATRDATRDATRTATYDATINATYTATYAATINATYTAANVNSGWAYQLALEIFGDHKNAVLALHEAKEWWKHYQGGNMWASWDCYLTAARDILGLKLPEHEKYAPWEQCAIHGGFRYLHEEFCLVCDFPEVLKKDAENRPHCENGPSHRWRDGWSLYFWHGVEIPGEWVTGKPPTAHEALTWPNIEQRRAACEIVGWSAILAELNPKVIDVDDDEQIGTLLEVDLPDSGKERFLKVRCGTKREFCLLVPNDMQTALEANAWTYGLTRNNFQPEVRT